MLIVIIILFIVFAGAGFYLYKRRGPTSPPKYTDDSITLRTVLTAEERQELETARQVITSVKNRRESILSLRRNSFDEASGEFVNLRNVKLSRALSCDSVVSDTSDFEGEQSFELPQSAERRIEIPDIATWLKNPTDFIKLKTTTHEDDEEYSNGHKNSTARNGSIGSAHESLEDKNTPQLLVSMSYLPTAERLSVVTVRMRLPREAEQNLKMVYVKAYLIDTKTGKRTCKKKTSLKALEAPARGQINVAFNELMIFKLPISQLNTTSVKMSSSGFGSNQSVSTGSSGATATDPLSGSARSLAGSIPIGSIVIGCSGPTKAGIGHWTTMMTTMRKPVTMWHVFQSGAEKQVQQSSNKEKEIVV